MPDTPRCAACFKHYLHKTFKSSIGRLGGGGRKKLAIAVSGGPVSAAVCLLYAHYISTLAPNPKASTMHTIILHVSDESAPPVVQTLAEHIPNSTVEVVRPAFDDKRIRDNSDRFVIHQASILKALVDCASDNNCDGLILGTCANRAAVGVLQALITGRGTAVPDLRAVFETDGVKVLRPVRDIAVRWLVRYAYIRLPKEQFVYGKSDAGIHDIIERFIEHAGADNAASVHNVVKTADKLKKNKGGRCVLCMSVVPKVSSDGAGEDCGDCQDCGCSQRLDLCDGCRACVERADGESNRVSEVIEEIATKERKRIAMENMRKQIEEFLL